jgi:uncharacterized protein YndB with AHSA1/START domain
MNIDVNVHDRILKPVGEVFAAVVDPARMAHYFISSASGPMEAGSDVEWQFADVGAKAMIHVIAVEQNRKIVYEPTYDPKTRTTIQFRADEGGATIVTINEAAFPLTEEGVRRAMGQTAGWTYFLACLKAYLQFGVELRRGLTESLTAV